MTAVWQRRGARLATALVVVVAAGVGLTIALADGPSEPTAPAATEELPAAEERTSAERVPPPWVWSGEQEWQAVGRFRFDPRSPVHVVTFRAANRTGEARSPDRLRVVGEFAGQPRFRFSAPCTGFDHDAAGRLRPVRSMVEPGEEIVVRCTDAMEYSGNRPRLLRSSLAAETSYCRRADAGRPDVC